MLQTPQDLLTFKLQTIRDAETQASEALRAQMGLAGDGELRQLLERRLQQGQQLLDVVSRGIEALGGQGAEDQNRAARGLIEQTAHAVELAQGPDMRQALLIAGVQELEHYCFSAWGTTKSLALELGQQEIADAMQVALDDGHALDGELSALAEGWVNPTAIEQANAGQADEGTAAVTNDADAATEGQRSSSDDLTSREYKGPDGKTHHHTKEYMERNPK